MANKTPEVPDAAEVFKADIDVREEQKKPRLLTILFCEYANETADKKLNLISVFDRFHIQKGTTTPRFLVFVRTAETLEGDLRLLIFDPKSKPVAAIVFGSEVERSGEYQQIQLLAPIQVQVMEYGLYWFDLKYKNQSLGGAGLSMEPLPESTDKNQ